MKIIRYRKLSTGRLSNPLFHQSCILASGTDTKSYNWWTQWGTDYTQDEVNILLPKILNSESGKQENAIILVGGK